MTSGEKGFVGDGYPRELGKEDYLARIPMDSTVRPYYNPRYTTERSSYSVPYTPSRGLYLSSSTRNLGQSPRTTTVSPFEEVIITATKSSGNPSDGFCADAPHYVVYSWVLCMVALAAFLKLYFLVKATIISILALTYSLLIFLVSDQLFGDSDVTDADDLKTR